LQDGNKLNRIFTAVQAISGLVTGTLTATGATAISGLLTLTGGLSLTGNYAETITTIAAAGATVGTATAIPAGSSSVFVTVTASTEGVKLPSITTVGVGSVITVIPSVTVGIKVYAGVAGQSIGAGTTNTTAVAVALNAPRNFIAVSATKWRIQ
jgi:hypothetical protein